MSYDSDMDELRISATRQGWRYQKTTRGHHQFYAPNRHDIITFSGTPGDARGFTNSVKQMEAAGYINPKRQGGPLAQSLAEQLRDQLKVADTSPPVEVRVAERVKRGLMPHYVREYMHAHPDKDVEIGDLYAAIKQKLPETPDRQNVAVVINAMIEKGEFKRIAMGVYINDVSGRYGDQPKTPRSYAIRRVDAPAATPAPAAPPPPPTPAPVAAPPTQPVEQVSSSNIDDDVAKLDRALAALGEIETVVRRHRDVFKQLAELQTALSKLGLKI